MKQKTNYHTHTFRCKHATGDVANYVEAAIQNNLDVLGISDHTPFPDNRWLDVRMKIDQLDGYIKAIDDARELYSSQISILKGMECEYVKEYHSFFQEELLEKHKFDYLIGGLHYYPYHNGWQNVYGGITNPKELSAYSKYVIQAMESGLFAFIAHPDLFGNSYLVWDKNAEQCSKDILQAAEQMQIPLEINGLGLRKPKIQTPNGKRCLYPLENFWRLASNYNIKVIVNSDAHRPEDIVSNIQEGRDIANTYHLKVIEIFRT